MDQDPARHDTCQARQEGSPKHANKSVKNSSRCENSSQQPGRYLCVDTRKEQVFVPRVRPNSNYAHNFSTPSTQLKHSKVVRQNTPRKNLKTVQNRAVQPDSHCKFKTTLAIEYVQDILEENATNSRPTSRQNSLKKNGQLKPLLGAGKLALEPNVRKCLGIQNDRRKKTVTLENGLEVREEAVSPGLTRFSSAVAKNVSQNTLTVDLRKLSLVDQSYSETITSDYNSTYEERPGKTSMNPANGKTTDIRRWSVSSHNHAIDDIDNQYIDDAIDHNYEYGDRVLDLRDRQIDRNHSDSDCIDYIDATRDDYFVNKQDNADDGDDIIDRNDSTGDDLFEKSSIGHQSDISKRGLKKSNDLHGEDIEGNKSRKAPDLNSKSTKSKRKLIYINKDLMNVDKKILGMGGEPSPKSSNEKFPELDNSLMDEKLDHASSKIQLHTSSGITDDSTAKSSRGCLKHNPQNIEENKMNSNQVVTAKILRDNTDLNRLDSEDDLLHLNRSSRTSTHGNTEIYESRLGNLSGENPDLGAESCRKVLDDDKVRQNTSSSSSFTSSNSTMPLFKPRNSEQSRETIDENLGAEGFNQETLENDEPKQSTSATALTSSTCNSKIFPSKQNSPGLDLNAQDIYEKSSSEKPEKQENNTRVEPLFSSSDSRNGTPDQDSIQVKDIWKALVDGGFEISREEVSKYKVNSTKPRIRSAPARRRSTHNNTFGKEKPIRAKSAIDKDSKEKLNRKCFGDLDEKVDSEGTMKNHPNVGGFFEEQSSETKLKPSHDSLYNDQSSLEVVAVSKPMTKLLRKKNILLVPPLNFQINTIPKSGHFFYFAYGLNMNQKRLEIQLRCQTGVRYWGFLFGFRLLFNKKGSTGGGVGFPNIIHEPGFSVKGCVYELSLDCLPLLDTCVGFPKHYSRLIVPVWLCNSLNPDEHGVAQHCVPAVVYVAQNDWITSDPEMLDSSFTLEQCVLGTDLLTPNYQRFLNGFHQRTASDENSKIQIPTCM